MPPDNPALIMLAELVELRLQTDMRIVSQEISELRHIAVTVTTQVKISRALKGTSSPG